MSSFPTSHIVYTPKGILAKAQEYFPNATGEMKMVDGLSIPIFALKLSPTFKPLHIKGAVILELFSNQLNGLLQKVSSNQAIGFKGIESVDEKEFCLQAALKEWKIFQRTLYGMDRCHAALCDYLEGKGEEGSLRLLGLAPAQMMGEISKEDRDLFDAISSKISKEALGKLKKEYPAVVGQFVKEEVVIRLEKASKNGDRFLEDTKTALLGMVVGQDHAVEYLVKLLNGQRNGSKSKAFLFVGPSGVGKTELAKSIASIKGGGCVRIDMNQCTHPTDTVKIFGSSVGYVGSVGKPALVKSIESLPANKTTALPSEEGAIVKQVADAVILLDELEKADSSVNNSLLTLIDEKYIKFTYCEGGGNSVTTTLKYKFSSSVIIGTSNLYKERILQAFKDRVAIEDISKEFTNWNSKHPVKHSFAGEFLARFEVTPFGPIPRGDPYQKLVGIKLIAALNRIEKKLRLKVIEVNERPGVLSYIEDRCYREGIDIRGLEKFIEKLELEIEASRNDWSTFNKELKVILSLKDGALVAQIDFYSTQWDTWSTLNTIVLPMP